MGERAYEQARICYGRPAADSELTEDYNPLEAGLQAAVSLTKACAVTDRLPLLDKPLSFRHTINECLSHVSHPHVQCTMAVALQLKRHCGYAGLFHWSRDAVQADQS